MPTEPWMARVGQHPVGRGCGSISNRYIGSKINIMWKYETNSFSDLAYIICVIKAGIYILAFSYL